MSSWNSYPRIWNMGHPQARELFKDAVVVEEKVDGSQFSFGLIDGELKLKSRGGIIHEGAVPNLFRDAVETVIGLRDRNLLVPGWTYRGEVLSRPKHNVLAYDRVPFGNIILFDITTDYETYMGRDEKDFHAEQIGLEVVPVLYRGMVTSADQLRHLLDTMSILGGQKIEGVVIKNYHRFGIDGKNLMGKVVSAAFKEVHAGEWRAANPGNKDIIDSVAEKLTTPARWQKAVIHARESGKLTDSPKDIGPLLGMIVEDVMDEEKERIKDALFKYAWKIIARRITHGFPEWYKQQLLAQQFMTEGAGIIDDYVIHMDTPVITELPGGEVPE